MEQAVTSQLQKDISKLLGREKIHELHRPNYLIDGVVILLLPSLAFIVGYLLVKVHFSVLWVVLLFAQGFIFQSFFLLSHELFIHRELGGKKLAYIGSLLFMTTLMTSPTAYKEVHLQHHYYLNTEKDTELIPFRHLKKNRFQRIILSTIFGIVYGHSYLLQARANRELHSKLRFESILSSVWIVFIIGLVVVWKPIIYAYLLPLIIALPIINVLRSIIEHVDADPEHPETGQFATYYKTNVFIRFLFLGDSGDCHLVHHIFWRLPFYRMPEALRVMEPHFVRIGVNVHRSYFKLLYGYYVKVLPLRTPWKDKL